MSSIQNQKLNQSLSFEDVSKLFSLPLTEAADILGVSTSDLKKLCNDNGLQRWPHRKYLAGKSIEDIKNEAAREKSKALERHLQANKHKNNVTTGLGASSSPGSHGKDKTVRYAIEISESEGNAQQQGSKTTLRPHQMLGSGLALDASAFSGEFKYGFPSDGLSRSSYKWWGSGSDDKDGLSNDECKTTSNVKDASEAQVENSLMVLEGRDKTDVASLSAIRKRALDEGLKALKSGALKRYGADQFQKEEKILLRRIFQARDDSMSSIQNQKLNQSLSFEDVSKLFSLPLTEAADILGVSTSDLKKLCNDNGLQRWPHRKYLAGKSIEDIKNEAAREKSKALERHLQANKHKNNVTTGLGASSSPGSHGKDKTVRYAIEISESEGNAQQQGSKTTLRPHQMLGSGLALDASAFSGEFKYGFPSDGLSRSSYKWWGSGSDDKDGLSNDECKTTSNVKDASEAQVENSLMVLEGRDKTDVASLSAIRKRALDEGLKALKSGALKRYGADQFQKEEKILLRRIFQAS